MKSVCLFRKPESVTADSGKEMLAMPIIIDSSTNKRFLDRQRDTRVKTLARSKAKMHEKTLRSFKGRFEIVLLYENLALFEDLSRHLQSIDLPAELACFCLNKAQERAKQLREVVEFERIYENVERLGLTDDVLTRSRKVPKRHKNREVLVEFETTLKNLSIFLYIQR